MNPEFITFSALPTRPQEARRTVRWPLCIMSKWKTTEAETSSVLDLCFQLPVTINNSYLYRLGLWYPWCNTKSQVIIFFSRLKCVCHDLWTLAASWSLFYSLDKSKQEPEVLHFSLQSILQCWTLVGAVSTIGQIPKVKISLIQRSQLCSLPTGFHNHSSFIKNAQSVKGNTSNSLDTHQYQKEESSDRLEKDNEQSFY